MRKVLFSVWERRTFENAYQEALNCAKKGNKHKSFEMFSRLVEKHPFDVNTRRQLLLLANDLGKEVTLPTETVMNLKQ